MAFNYNKLIGRIIEKFGTRSTFADVLGITDETLSRKLNGKSFFSQDEIMKSCELLGIDCADIHMYFFAVNSQFA